MYMPNAYLLGNSVTRHYATALCAAMGGSRQLLNLTRDEERRSRACQAQSMATTHCVWSGCGEGQRASQQVTFYWKNDLVDDTRLRDERDICARALVQGSELESTHACLRSLLAGASVDDVLVVGSMASNATAMRDWYGAPATSVADDAPRRVEATRRSDLAALLSLLLTVFPGLVVWHSYAHLVARHDTHGRVGPATNLAIAEHNELVMRASWRAASRRLRYLDLSGLQALHEDEYHDLIHHPGALSEHIAQLVLELWGSWRAAPLARYRNESAVGGRQRSARSQN